MSISLLKTIGRLGTAASLVATIAIGYWATLPPKVAPTASASSVPSPLKSVPAPPEIPRYATLAPLVDQRLRGPLYDPPPPPPPVVPPPEPIRVNLKLVGTVLEAGRNQALLANPQGKILFCRVGETISSHPGDIFLESVSEQDAVLRVTSPRESMVTLTIERNRRN